MNKKQLGIYLNDHLAGADALIELAKHCLSHNRHTPLGDCIADLLGQLDEDRGTLLQVMEATGVKKRATRQRLAVIAGKARRLTSDGSFLGYTDLSRIMDLEGLRIGIEGKRCLWSTLQKMQSSGVDTDAIDFDELLDRASQQQMSLEPHRLEATAQAFAAETSAPPPPSAPSPPAEMRP